MNRDPEQYADPVALPAELTPPAVPRPATSAAIAQVIERTSARYIADLHAFSAELSQQVQTSERETLAAPPSELAHQQETLPTQIENADAGFPSPETSTPHSGEAPAPLSVPAHPSQTGRLPEYVARTQAQRQTLNVSERLGLQELAALFSYWPWILFLLLMGAVGVLIGMGSVLFLQ